MNPRLSDFSSLSPADFPFVSLANNAAIPVLGQGTVVVHGPTGPVCINNVLYVPALSFPLLSVPAVYNHGGRVEFSATDVSLFSSSSPSTPVLVGRRDGNTWILPLQVFRSPLSPLPSSAAPASPCLDCDGRTDCLCQTGTVCPNGCALAVHGADPNQATGSWELWHSRLAHLGWHQLRRLLSSDLVTGTQATGRFPPAPECDTCLEGKMHRHPFSAATPRATRPLERVCTDLMGPLSPSVFRHKYIMVIVDEYTRYAWVFFLKQKSHASQRIKDFFAYAQRQFGRTISCIRSDRGGEFLSEELLSWYERNGIVHELSIRNTPQQNGIAERYNRTLTERARSLLLGSGLPVRFWEHAVSYASWLSNRLPSSALSGGAIPYTRLWGRPPTLAPAKVFGCLSHVWLDPGLLKQKLKWGPRSQWAVFLGVSEESKGWTFYVPSSGETGFLSRNAYFHEDLFLHDLQAQRGVLPDSSPSNPLSASQREVSDLFSEQVDSTPHPARRVHWADQPGVATGPPARVRPLDPSEGDVEDDFFVPSSCSPPSPPSLGQGEFFPARDEGGGSSLSGSEIPVPSEGEGTPLAESPPSQGEDTSFPTVPTHSSMSPSPPRSPVWDQWESPGTPLQPNSSPDGPALQEPVLDEVRALDDFVRDEGAPRDDSSSGSESESDSDPSEGSEAEAAPLLRRGTRVRRAPAQFSPSFRGNHRITLPRSSPALAVVLPPPPAAPTLFSLGSRWHKGSCASGHARAAAHKQALVVPTNLRQADASVFAEEWLEARHKELDRLVEMGTWHLVPAPQGANILGSKWVFALKTNPDGTISRHKARLVVQGFGQIEGLDFEETFANTAGKMTVRGFLAIVTVLGMRVKQVDVTTAFLYGNVDKDIFMRQPPGHDDGTSQVCKLRRALYGLKQSPRIWEETLRTTLHAMGFSSSKLDPCLYLMKKDGQDLFLLDFVDDMLIASHSQDLVDWCFSELCRKFEMTDDGEPQKYIGLHIHHDRELGEMWVHQGPYILEMATKFGLSNGPFPDTPLPSDWVLLHDWEADEVSPPPGVQADPPLDSAQKKRYQQLVGSLNYAAHSTRIDISHAVNQLSRAQQTPRSRHLAAAERVVRYLVGTANLGLHFSKSSGLTLECYVDASYSKQGTKKAITGFLLVLGGAPIMWTCRKQDRITTSTCDAESYAVVTAVQYVEFARDMLAELGCIQSAPTPVHNDNSATINLCYDALSHKKSVQLTRQMAYVRERTLFGVISPRFISTKDQPADYLTKRLDAASFQRCCALSGLHPLPSSSPSGGTPCGPA